MDREALMKLLDLAPTPVKASSPPPRTPGAEKPAPGGPVSATALVLDRWDMERGKKTLENSPEAARLKLSEAEMADFYACAFLAEPALAENSAVKLRREYVEKLLEAPDTKALRESSVFHLMASEMAAVQFAAAYAKLKKDEEAEPPDPTGDPDKEGRGVEMRALVAAHRAAKKALARVEEIEEMVVAMPGCGLGRGGNSPLEYARLKEAFTKARNNEMLREAMNRAGRYVKVAQAHQRRKTLHGYDDVVGVTPGGDIDRLTVSELANLSDDDLSDDAVRRIVERQAMCRDHRGVDKVGKGPIVVCVDESGSMDGEPIYQAKGFALGMAWVAHHQRRWCALVGYSGGREGTLCVLPPNKWDENALMDWVSHFYGGGTTLDVPLHELPNVYWPKVGAPRGKTDVIIVTDAIVNVGPAMRDSWNEWRKREKVRCLTMVLGSGYGYDRAGGMKEVSDEVYYLDRKSLRPDHESVTRALSI